MRDNTRTCLKCCGQELSREGGVEKYWRWGSGSMSLQRKQKDTGVDPEHSETRGWQSVLRKRSGGTSRWKDQQEGVERRKE